MRKITRVHPATLTSRIQRHPLSAVPLVRSVSSDALITPLGDDERVDGATVTARDVFDQLEDTDAQTGIAPGDPGSDKPYEGDM